MFDAYSLLLTKVTDHVRDTVPRDPNDSDFVYRQATRAKALDAVRGVLPAASLSNVGIYGTGQALRGAAAAHAGAPAARGPALRRPDAARAPQGDPELPAARRPARPWRPLESTTWRPPATDTASSSSGCSARRRSSRRRRSSCVDFDPDAEDKLLAAICYPHTQPARAPDRSSVCASSASTSGSR